LRCSCKRGYLDREENNRALKVKADLAMSQVLELPSSHVDIHPTAVVDISGTGTKGAGSYVGPNVKRRK
jgi:hypothetical protein